MSFDILAKIYYYAKATLEVTDVQEDALKSSTSSQHSPKIKDKRSGSISSKIEFTPKRPEPKVLKPENKQVRVPFKVLEKFGILKAHPVSSPKVDAKLPFSGSISARLWLDRNAYFPGSEYMRFTCIIILLIFVYILGETVLSRLKINSTWVKPLRNISINVCFNV